MARCVVVGGNGFLGAALVDQLVAEGHEVTAFDRFSAGVVSYRSSTVRQVVGDFMNHADVAAALEGQQYVFHFVSTTTPASAESDPTLDIRTNLISTVDLLQACVAAGVEHVYYASTGGAIYGDQPGVALAETVAPLPVSPYAIGKLAIEGYLRYFRAKSGLASTVFRISNPYGPGQRPTKRQGVIPIFLQRLRHGQPVTVLGDGSMVRDFVYVDDVVRMVTGAVGRDTRHSLYNVGRGEGTTIAELLEVIEDVTGLAPAVERTPIPSTFVKTSVLDTARYESEFGPIDYVPLREGVALTWAGILESER
ncbi:NAD-dependent epimerase/dehydratase family protein [Cnuibacter sp. UC19_7]|uniref:NAD-dependent epimerase/dehydratase family protein n=1 Tax=Cnuibacter sp. UC19_7 TaxID=3350166 RepID=UPI00366BCDB7